jgi:hypothetical protein
VVQFDLFPTHRIPFRAVRNRLFINRQNRTPGSKLGDIRSLSCSPNVLTRCGTPIDRKASLIRFVSPSCVPSNVPVEIPCSITVLFLIRSVSQCASRNAESKSSAKSELSPSNILDTTAMAPGSSDRNLVSVSFWALVKRRGRLSLQVQGSCFARFRFFQLVDYLRFAQ